MWWNRSKQQKAPKRNLEAERQAELDREAAETAGRTPRAVLILLGIAGAVAGAFGLWAIQGFAAPVILALVLTICVHPLRVAMEKRGVPRGIATTSVVTAVFVLLAAFVTALVLALSQFVTLLPTFAPQLEKAGKNFGAWLQSIGVSESQIHAITTSSDPTKLVGVLTGLLGSVTSLTFALVVILTCLILMAADAGYLGALFEQIRPEHKRVVIVIQSFASNVRRYMVATTVLGIAQGVLNAAALLILQVPGAFLWGLLSFLCSFIPNIGYFIAIIPPLVFGFLTGGWPTVIWILIWYTLVNAVVQSIIQPRVVGNAVALSQTITFVSVLFWAVVLGAIGAILAIPLTLIVRMILIDTDPNARWWRPVLGDFSQTKVIQKAADAERKQQRKSV
jgi:AI-2 transport protein TqsA